MVVTLQRGGRAHLTQMIWDAELYWSPTYIQISHTAPRSRMGTAMHTPWWMASTYRMNCVRVVGRIPRPDQWRRTPLFNSSFSEQTSTSCQLGLGSCNTDVNSFTSGRRNLLRLGMGSTQHPCCKKNRQAIAIFSPWMSYWTTVTRVRSGYHRAALNKLAEKMIQFASLSLEKEMCRWFEGDCFHI